MQMPLPVDEIEILILVDNMTDNLSSVPDFVESELASLNRRRSGAFKFGGDCLCCAAHGLSCLIRIHKGAQTQTILFDTGPEDRTFEQNVSRLGANLGMVEALVLSHGHWDHAGALLRALQMILDRNGGKRVPCYVHPDMFRNRAIKRPDGDFLLMQDVPSVDELKAYGANVVNGREPKAIADDLAWVSGEIPRVTPYETGLPGQHRRSLDGNGWEVDELIMDERCLVVNIRDKGLVVFTACSHAGVINVLNHARKSFPDIPIHAVVGGLHLSGINERVIPNTVEDIKQFELSVIAAGHCTGFRAIAALLAAFGDKRLVPLSVGKQFTL